jgi:hypothetical protein
MIGTRIRFLAQVQDIIPIQKMFVTHELSVGALLSPRPYTGICRILFSIWYKLTMTNDEEQMTILTSSLYFYPPP